MENMQHKGRGEAGLKRKNVHRNRKQQVVKKIQFSLKKH